MNIITKEIDFDYAHRVPLHNGKCSSIHGHRATVTVEITGELRENGPQTGMVFDYGFIKQLLMEHVDAKCDHGIILAFDDFKFVSMCYNDKLRTKAIGGIFSDWHREVTDEVIKNTFWSGETNFGKTYIIDGSPTAENLAAHFFNVLEPLIPPATNFQACLSAVTFKETPSSSATYRINE
jgi:6-pyruvoyltetrahydropterin/6-carboxytetrahydropterin synthase